MTYELAAQQAQRGADASGYDHGVIGPDAFGGWACRMLPVRRHRFGHEMTCEVRMSTMLDKCKPGHGPDLGGE